MILNKLLEEDAYGFALNLNDYASLFNTKDVIIKFKSIKKHVLIKTNANYYLSKKLGSKLRRIHKNGKIVEAGPDIAEGVNQGTFEYSMKMNDLILDLANKVEENTPDFSSLGLLASDNSFFPGRLNINFFDGDVYRQAIGLNKPNDIFLVNGKILAKELTNKFRFESVRIRKKSQSGFPFFCFGKEKSFLAYYGLDRAQDTIKAFDNCDLDFLFREGLFPVFTQNERLTPQKHKVLIKDGKLIFEPKEKKIINAELAISLADKRHGNFIDFVPDDLIINMPFDNLGSSMCYRLPAHGRVVLGMNISLNVLAQSVDAGLQKVLKTFSATRMDSNENLIEEFKEKDCVYFLSWDYSSFDASNTCSHGSILRILFDSLEDIFCKQFVTFLIQLRSSPVFYYSTTIGQSNNPKIVGRFFSKDGKNGESSGFGMVAIDGKFPAAVVSGTLISEFYNESFLAIMNNENDKVHCKFMGDDALFGFKNESDRDNFKKFVTKLLAAKLIPFDLSFEPFANFCGNIFMDGGNLLVDGAKFLSSVLYAERNFSRKPNGPLGFQTKLNRFMSSGNKFSKEIYQALDQFFKYFGHDISDFAKTNPLPKTNYEVYEDNWMMREIEEEPEKLLWKYPIENFDPNFVQQFFTTIPAEVIETYLADFV